ncbi:MAG: 30S ribosome-binding factor RbfA [Methylococcales bacterium]|nr:30S ribosome-binding factor RbfA [Methylococcales bacterium]
MAKEYGRSERVSSQMQKELAYVLHREIEDPRLGFITVNEVVVSKDLAMAKIYVTILNADNIEKANSINALNELAPMIRHQVAKRMRLRHISNFKFYYDNSFDTGMRIAELLIDHNKKEQG